MANLEAFTQTLVSQISPESCESILRLLVYPLDHTQFDFTISDAELSEFYSVGLYRIIHRLYTNYFQQKSVNLRNILQHIVHFSKPDVVFQYLVDQLDQTQHLSYLVHYLELFIFDYNRVQALFLEWCSSSIGSPTSIQILEKFARSLVILPTRLSNVSQGRVKSRFLNRVSFVHAILSAFTSPKILNFESLHFYGLILSQLALSEYANDLAIFILNDTEQHITAQANTETFLWSAVLCHLKETCLERLLLPILHNSRHFHLVAVLLSSSITGPDMRMRKAIIQLFRRLLFVRYFPDGKLLRNIFGALADVLHYCPASDISTTLIHTVNEQLGLPSIRLWADATSIQSTSIEQRVYITQALASWITDFRTPVASKWSIRMPDSELLPDILTGISNHLSSPRSEIRIMGMAMGEWLMSVIDFPHDLKHQEPLKFTYDETEAVKQIKHFFVPLPPFCVEDRGPEKTCSNTGTAINNQITEPLEFNRTLSESGLDSDDDPDSEDQQTFECLPQRPGRAKAVSSILSTLKKPKYLRECIDGMMLTKPEDNPLSVICFASVTSLIYAHPQSARELTTELARILVHVESPACPEDVRLATHRHSALVALGTVAPRECARYLTHEFFQPTCSVGQRHNIISAITDIACQLSASDIADLPTPFSPTNPKSVPLTTSAKLAAQTRRFCSPCIPKPQTVNRFAAVANEFFFPLLRSIPQLFASSQTGTFAHQDAGLLSSLITSLATVYACARGSSHHARMATELVESIPPLYRHSEPAVRRAVLLVIGTVISTTPVGILSGDPQLFLGSQPVMTALTLHSSAGSSGFSVPSWLRRCLTTDPDSECQILASASLALLNERIDELCHL